MHPPNIQAENMPRSPSSLSGFDLNLLVIFDALMAERHLTRAAERVGLSQPGVSHALARLRHLTGDRLFERRRDGMEPTPRALALAEPVGASLARLRRSLIGDTAFDPGAARQRFAVVMSDAFAAVLLPPLVGLLRREAPGVDLRLLPTGLSEGLDHVLGGGADIGIGVYPNLPTGVSSAVFDATRLVCVADARHPRLAQGFDRQAFVELPHVAVSDGEARGSNIDAILTALGLDRRVMLNVAHYLLVPRVIAGSDLLAVLPEKFVDALSDHRLRAYPLPVETSAVNLRMIWRERNDEDEAQAWFRRKVREALDFAPAT